MKVSAFREERGRTEALLKGKTGFIAAALAIGLFAINLARQIIPPLIPDIITSLSLSPSTVGFAMTLLWVCFAAVQYPGGRLSDELSRKTVIVVALGIAAFGLAFFVLATRYWMLLAGASLLGAGAGAYLVSMRAYLGDLYSDRRGQAIGVNQAAGNIGSMSAGFLAIFVIAISFWQLAFAIIVPLVLVSLVLVHATSSESYSVGSVSFQLKETFVRIFATNEIRYLVLSYALVNFTYKGILSFLPTFLQITKSFTSTEANLLYAAFFVAGIVVVPTAGALSDRFPRLKVIVVSVSIAIVGLAIVISTQKKVGVIVGVIVFAGGLSGFPAVAQSHLLGTFPPSNAGGDFGAFRTIYLVIGSLGPTYVGVIAEHFTYVTAFGSFIALLSLCLFLVFLIDNESRTSSG